MSHQLRTKTAAVATPHPQAARAAREILTSGGNAVDAAVASMITLCVVLPGSVGLGGYGGSMVIHLAGQKNDIAIDFDSRAPLAFREELFAKDPATLAYHGYLAVTVPGIVAGLDRSLDQFGTMKWKQVARHAAEIAENGFPMEAENHAYLQKWRDGADSVSRNALFRDGKIPDIGQPWVQKDLARLIRRLGDEGPKSFYRGEIARTIVQQVHDHGGILSEEDFSRFEPSVADPIRVNYRGYDVITPPPPSGGITMLAILKTLERFDIASMKPFEAPYFHLFSEAAKLCWVDRNKYVGDPDIVHVPVEQILSPRSADERAATLKKGGVSDAPPAQSALGPHTANVSVIDAERNAVSITATQGYQFGSRVVIDGLGLVMGHGMSRFDFKPDHPNKPAAGKRMHHNMAPTIILTEGKPFAALGLPGGPKIITVTAQLAMDLVDFKMNAGETVVAPRVHTDGDEPLSVSAWAPARVFKELEAMGHTVIRGQQIGGAPNEVAGPANAVVVENDGFLAAATGAAPDAVAGI